MITPIVKINILTGNLPSTQVTENSNSKKKIKNVSPLRIRAYHMSRVIQAVLLVDGQVLFLGVRRPTLRLIRLKMSEIILTGRKTQIKKGGKMKIKKKKL